MKCRAGYVAALLVVFGSQSQAAERLQAESLSCGKLQQTIEAKGSVLVQSRSKNGNVLYGLYVRDDQSCQSDEVVETAYLPSADRPSCPVKRCVDYPNRP